ncbi:MAG: hypothetical protein WC975_06750 [Phycisphaerae bacterium]
MRSGVRGWCVLTDRFRLDLGKNLRQVRFCWMTVWQTIGKQKRYPSLSLTVIHAREINCPKYRKPV